MKIAIIGTGISGLGIAYLLNANHDITLYEKKNYIGGHSRTINVPINGQQTPVDTGFIVFNDWNYPNLFGLFDHLGVKYEKSDMSFGISIKNGWLEYGSYNLFAQTKNFIRPKFWGMLADILKFNKKALAYIESEPDVTLKHVLDKLGMKSWFRKYYLLAMGASIWSCPISQIMQFPASTYLRFFKNHGLLSVNNRPQWYTVTGGSKEYVEKLTASFKDKIKLSCGVQKVMQEDDQWVIEDINGNKETFDQIVFASHADETLSMIENPTSQEKEILGAFQYQKNKVVVHKDESFMPKNKKCWASWVYLSEERDDNKEVVSLTYWMNNLQNFDKSDSLLVTLNPGRKPNADKIINEHEFTHPIFDVAAIKSQSKIQDIQGKRGLWFCGAYQRYGFHEDGLLSAVNVAKFMGVEAPWNM